MKEAKQETRGKFEMTDLGNGYWFFDCGLYFENGGSNCILDEGRYTFLEPVFSVKDAVGVKEAWSHAGMGQYERTDDDREMAELLKATRGPDCAEAVWQL